MTFRRVAPIADVHGNAPALAAVLREVEAENVDLLVHAGDLTWSSLVVETFALIRGYDGRAEFVSGNADRAVLELAGGTRTSADEPTAREQWLRDRHDAAAGEFLRSYRETVVVDIERLGAVRVCHGSPRGDTECVTSATPPERVHEFMAEVGEKIVATAHTHVQFDRRVDRIRSLNPGSVGLPYEGMPGAYWPCSGRMSSYAGPGTTTPRRSPPIAGRTIPPSSRWWRCSSSRRRRHS